MQVIRVRNVHEALVEGCYRLSSHGIDQDSRNGKVRMFPFPVTTTYTCPQERVVFHPERDANPFFHFFESLWMLAGRNDVDFVEQFNGGMVNYSDDGKVFNAAYGFRWRNHFGSDQLKTIAEALKTNPNCRRQVLAIWDGKHDLGLQSKDLPCNTQVYFQMICGMLNMMVCNRSNDMVWGAYGANAVHFSYLQEYMACLIGCEVGEYHQVSMNLHLYLEHHGELMRTMAERAPMPPEKRESPYGQLPLFPLMSIPHGRWQRELSTFLEQPQSSFTDPLFEHVAKPMYAAWRAYKDRLPNHFDQALQEIRSCAAADWQLACTEWLMRRKQKWMSRSS